MGIPPELLVASGFGLAIAAIVWALNDWLGTPAIARRAARALKSAPLRTSGDAPIDFKARFVAAVRTGAVDRILGAERLSDMLIRSGSRSRDALNSVLFMKFAMPFMGLWLGWNLDPVAFAVSAAPGLTRPAGALIVAAVCFFGPDLIVFLNARERRAAIRRALPDAIDLFSLSVQAGLSLENAIPRTIAEMERRSPELADELRVLSAEIAYLPDRRLAYDNFRLRCRIEEIDELVLIVQQSERYGTSLGDALRQLSRSTRIRQLSEVERKAMQLPAKLTLPIMGFLLPGIVVMIFAPMLLAGFMP